MKLEAFKQILNKELVACFKEQICSEKDYAQFINSVNHADDLGAMLPNISYVYGLPYLVQVWDEVKKTSKVSEAVKCVVAKHKIAAAEKPCGTSLYQYSCIVAARLESVLIQAIEAELFNTPVLNELVKYLTQCHAALSAVNINLICFGQLNPAPQRLFSQPQASGTEVSEAATRSASKLRPGSRFTFNMD